ncbi:SGNH/GDSL hydrolase family protein [Paenochrobactrum glaciei]
MVFPLLLPQSTPAHSQTLFDMLFGEKKAAPPAPPAQKKPAPQRQVRPKKPAPPAPRKPSAAQIPIPIPAPKQLVQKLDDANNVLVLGDFSSSGLADGLMEAFSDNPSVQISDLSNGSSGFVRQDYYNWNQSISTLLEQEKPAAVVMMIGANDRQVMDSNGKIRLFASDEWKADYKSRIENFTKTVQAAGYPLIWVGQPPYAARAMSKDMLALNEIYRQTAEKAGASFVDIWDGFANEDGDVVITGLDINGQEAQLRSPDGIGLTTAGKRKLAFYVEKPLRKILSDSEQQDEPAATSSSEAVSTAPSRIDRVPAVSLRDYGADHSGILLGSAPAPAQPNAHKHDNPYSPYPERADYFRSITNK